MTAFAEGGDLLFFFLDFLTFAVCWWYFSPTIYSLYGWPSNSLSRFLMFLEILGKTWLYSWRLRPLTFLGGFGRLNSGKDIRSSSSSPFSSEEEGLFTRLSCSLPRAAVPSCEL
jgi:hypothetical protein